MPTTRACLAGVAGINPYHFTTPSFGLVFGEASELCERPAMQPATLAAPPLNPLPDVGQVLQCNRPADWRGFYDTLRNDVIAVAAEPELPAPEDSQPAFCRFRPFGLTLPFLPEDFGLDVPPASLSEELSIGGDGRAANPEIHADDMIAELLDDDMQPPLIITPDQIGGAYHVIFHALGIGRRFEAYRLSALGGGESDSLAFPIHPKCMDVVPRRTEPGIWAVRLTFLSEPGKGRFDRLRGFHPCLNVQVAHQGGEFGLEQPVREVMKLDPVLFFRLPSGAADGIEGGGEESGGFRQHLSLAVGGFEF